MHADSALRKLSSIDARRICVIKPSAFGDVVQTLPLLPVLRERFPAARISWVINRGLADLVDRHPCVDDVIRFDRNSSLAGSSGLLWTLWRRRFDLVFDLQGLLRTGVMTAATRAPVRVGLESAREGAHLACHVTLPDSGRFVPAHARYWRVAEALGLGDRARQTVVPILAEDRAWARRRLGSGRARILAVQPGARWETKRWPAGHFAAVAAKASRRFGLKIVLVGGPDEVPLVAQVEWQLKRFVPAAPVLNLAGRTTLRQLAAVLDRSNVLLTNDSGPMHLAAGLGTPVVGVFTCTSPQRSGPPGPRHALVAAPVSCAGSYHKRCPFQGAKHMSCMAELQIDRVWLALAGVLEREAGLPRAA